MEPAVTCPNCGAEVPADTGQHALTPSAGVVECPSCGAHVTLPKPGAREEEDAARAASDVARAREAEPVPGAPESFAGEETVEGVMEELEEKEDR